MPDLISTFTTIFLSIFIEAVPFLLLGTLASGLVEVLINQDEMARLVPRGAFLAALTGSLLGIFFPVCECGVVPLTRRLYRKGVPISMGISFLLAAPVINPITIASTFAAFGPGPVFWLRIGLTLVIAIATGMIFSLETERRRMLLPGILPEPVGKESGIAIAAPAVPPVLPAETWRQKTNRVLVIAGDEFFEMSRYLVIGSFLAAFMQTLVPRSALEAISRGPILPVLVLTALAVILSVCSTVDAFIALAFVSSFTTGSILAFLVYGPMVDIKSTLMFLRVFPRRVVVYLVLLPLLLTVLATVSINLVMR
jgi:uncharacterized protein